MAKKRSFLQSLNQDPTSKTFGSQDYNTAFGKLPELDKLSEEDKFNLDAEIAQQTLMEEQLANAEKVAIEQEEAKKYAPKDALEEDVASIIPQEKFKNYKDIKERIASLENKNKAKTADKNSSFFDENGVNLLAPVYWLADAILPDTTGMTKNEKKEYKDLITQRSNVETPIALAKLKQVDTQIKSMQTRIPDPANPGKYYTQTSEENNSAMDILTSQKKVLEKFINNEDGILDGLSTQSRELYTAGLNSLSNKVDITKVVLKARNGEELTQEDNNLLAAYNSQQQVENLDLGANRFFYRTGQGTGQSAVFMEQMLATGGVGTGAGAGIKAIVTPLTDRMALGVLTAELGTNLSSKELAKLAAINYVEKGLIGTGEVLTQALAMPSTYENTARKFIGQTQLVNTPEGEKVLVTASARKAFEKDSNASLAILNQELSKLNNKPNTTEKDLNRINEIISTKEKIVRDLNSIYDPSTGDIQKDVSKADAAIYGYTENLKEIASEKYVGELMPMAGKKLANKLAGSRLEKFMKPVSNVVDNIANKTGLGKLSQIAAAKTGSAKIFHGLPGEVLEEIAVQLTPTYQEDYSKQLEELANPRFYQDVIAQTLMIGAGFTGAAKAKHLANYYTDKEYKKNYKAGVTAKKDILETYKALDKAVSNDAVAEHIIMNTGGSLFELSDYQRKVAELRTEGKDAEADKLEKKSFTNLAIQALQTGTIDKFDRSLKRLQLNENLDEKTKQNALSARTVVQELSSIQEEHGSKPNFGTIANLAINRVLNNQTLAELDNKIAGHLAVNKLSFDKYNKERGQENYKDYSTILDELNTDALDVESNNIYVNYINNLSKDNIGNIGEYLALRNARENIEELDFQNESELNYQLNPANFEKFRIEKRKQSEALINKAKDKESVNTILQEAQEENIADEVLSTTADAKLNELDINERLDTVFPKQENTTLQDQPIPNSASNEFSEEELALLEDHITQNPDKVNIIPNENIKDFFSRQSAEPTSNDAEVINKVAKELDTKLNREANLRDFIYRRIEVRGLDKAEELFQAHVKLWAKTNRDISNADDIYTEFFGTDALLEEIENRLVGTENTNALDITQTSISTLTNLTQETPEFNLHGAPINNSIELEQDLTDRRTTSSTPRLSHYHQEYERGPNGEYIVTSENLTNNNFINNSFVLDSDSVNKGSVLRVEVADNDDILITEHTGENNTPEKISWGAYKAKYNLTPEDIRYINKVPIIAYKGDTPISFIPDATWFNTTNINHNLPEDRRNEIAQKGFDNVSALRSRILAGENEIVISHRAFGSIDKINNHKESKLLTLNQATGDTQLARVVQDSQGNISLETNKNKKFTGIILNDVNKLINNKKIFNPGGIADIRWIYNDENNNPVYYAMPVLTKSISSNDEKLIAELPKDSFNSIKYAVLAATVLNNQDNAELLDALKNNYNITISKANEIKNKINSSTGINIKNNLVDYAANFIQIGSAKYGRSYFTALQNKQGNLNEAFFDNVVANELKVYYKYKEGSIEQAKGSSFGSTVTNTSQFITNFNKAFGSDSPTVLRSKSNVNYNALNREVYSNTPFVTFNENGEAQENHNNYNHFVKDHLYTNVKSHEITTESGEKKFITDIQPMLYFEIKSNVDNNINNVNTLSENIVETKQPSEEILTETQSELDKFRNSLTPEEKVMFDLLSNNTDNNSSEFSSRRVDTPEEQKKFSKFNTNKISTLSPKEQKDLVGSLKNLIISKIDFKSSVSENDVRSVITSSVNEFVLPKLNIYKNILSNMLNIPALAQSPEAKGLQERIDKLEGVITEQLKLTSLRLNNKGSLVKEFDKLLNLDLQESQDLDIQDLDNVTQDEEDNEVNKPENADESYSKSLLEKDLKLSYSNKLRLSLFGIPKLKESNKEPILSPLTGFAEYLSADDVELVLKDITTEIPSDWNLFMEKLNSMYLAGKGNIYSQLYNKFSDENIFPEHLKNELLYKMISARLNIYKVLNRTLSDNTGLTSGYQLQVIDENGQKEDIKLRNNIRDYFIYNSVLSTSGNNNTRILNKQVAEKFVIALDKLSTTEIDFNKLKEIFTSLGLDFSDNTIQEYLKNNKPFNTKDGILSYVNKNLKALVNKANNAEVILSDSGNNLYDGASGALNKLISKEIELNGTTIAKAIRVGGKVMQGTIQNTSAYDTVKALTGNINNILDIMQDVSYTRNNVVLELIRNDENFRNSLSIDFASPEAYKIHGKDIYSDVDFDQLSPQDNFAVTLGLFTNIKGFTNLLSPTDIRKGLTFRIGQMPFNTLSDKGRMVYMKSALLDTVNNIELDSDNNIILNDDILNYLNEQLFESEFNRIVDAYKYGDQLIEGYDNTSKIFTLIPKFNTLSIDGINIHDILRTGRYDIAPYKAEINKILGDVINSEVNKKLSQDATEGEFITYNMSQGQNVDSEYLNKFSGDKTQQLRLLLADYSINYLLNQANVYQLFLGDAAFYSKDKFIPVVKSGDVNYIDSAKLVNNYISIAKKISVIIDKRAASLIAPGNKLANSQDTTGKYATQYLQVQVQDVESMSGVMRELIQAQYGELTEDEENALNRIEELNKEIQFSFENGMYNNLYSKGGLLDLKQEAIQELSESNEDIKDYFNANGTDAQEYTTWKTHIDTLLRQGELTSEEEKSVKSAYEKLSQGKFNEVTAEEINIVMQPIKPVYTGQIPLTVETIDEQGNRVVKVIAMRPIYIKSSSFPLLPQLTKNLKIDAVRSKLEELENNTGKTVRMSYQTANKIGASKSNLTMNDLYYKDLSEIYNVEGDVPSGVLADAVLTLDLANFKIQQENPYKTKKYLAKNQDNQNTMGSQFWKIILGNGINQIDRKIFPNLFSEELLSELGIEQNNNNISGQDLDKIDFEVYKRYSSAQKKLLYSELGLDENTKYADLTFDDKVLVMDNLISLVRDEIVKRGYPDYLQNVLGLNIQEQDILTEIPLMLDANANKFEALLQAIVSNRLISHKLPGNGHISASSEGFERITNLEEISSQDRLGIVWFNPNHSGKLQATKLSNGRITESEVLIQSHYRVTSKDSEGNKITKLIDFTSDEYSDVIRDAQGKITGRSIRLDKIDEKLLSMFSFRIPTSSHQSGVILKIAGFLPPQLGDLLLVPAEHTVQLGEDYDIDKRYIYKNNYEINEGGIITELQYSNNKDAYTRLLESIVGEDELATDKDLKAKIKMYENIMLNIYKSVYTSPDAGIQQKIFKPLVTNIADTSANLMDAELSGDIDENFTMLGDSYQRYLLKLGADGKGGIGKHSNAVTFEAQLQRLDANNKVRLLKSQYNNITKESDIVPSEENIGDLKSDGFLGKSFKSLDGFRDIAEQHGENQNVSTDNINKQIMGKRNENSFTMGVYAMMAMRGYDLSLDKVITNYQAPIELHIPSLFVNQPILRDYVQEMESLNSITAEYASDKESYVVEKLIRKYEGTIPERFSVVNFMNKNEYTTQSDKMSGQVLWDNLNIANADNALQLAVLQKFMRFKNEERELAKVQRLINLSTSKLGISYFETLQRISMLNELPGISGEVISNATKLIGDYKSNPLNLLYFAKEGIAKKNPDFTPEQVIRQAEKEANEKTKELLSQGYRLIGRYYWKAETKEGIMLLNSLESAQDLMNIFFPYNEPFVYNTIQDIFAVKDKDVNESTGSALKWKYEIISSMRDYMYSDSNLNLFQGDVNQERRRLFLDVDNNTPLASILLDLRKIKHPIMENSFMKDLDMQVREGSVSLILSGSNHNTTFDKSTKYDEFLSLFNDESNLGIYNGEVLTPHKLAQDLATYSMLADNQNGATGFRDFIHIDYLKSINFTEALRNKFTDLRNNLDSVNEMKEGFVQQYFQHHPNRAFILSANTLDANQVSLPDVKLNKSLHTAFENGKNINSILTKSNEIVYYHSDDNARPKYISVRDTSIKNSENKFSLYKQVGNSYNYTKIETLGTTGYNEYNANAYNQVSQIPGSLSIVQRTGNKYFDTGLNQIVQMVNISERIPVGSTTLQALEVYLNSPNTPDEVKEFIAELIKYGDLDVKITYAKPINNALGSYNADTNEIYIHPDIFEKVLAQNNNNILIARDIVREIILEEVIHSMTVKEFSKYVASNNNKTGEISLVTDAPLFANKLLALYQAAKESLPYDPSNVSTYYSKNIYEFMAGMFVAPDYRERLEKSNPGIIKRFLSMLKSLLGNLYSNSTGQILNYNSEVFKNVYELLKTRESNNNINNLAEQPNPIEAMKQDDIEDINSRRLDTFRYPEIKKC